MNRLVVLSGAALLLAPLARAEDANVLREIGKGRGLFLAHCTYCHGTDAKGGPAVARGRSVQAPDLTLVEARDGRFNSVHVSNHIRGQEKGEVMANWVSHLAQEPPLIGEMGARVKVAWITRYLESIQGLPEN